MADVSQVAGVSVSTVSHVINESRPVPDSTRRRVLDAIDQTGYVRNTLARSLRVSETRTIGLAVDKLSIPYFLGVIEAIDHEARSQGYSVLLSDFESDPSLEMRQVQSFVEHRVDAMVISPSARGGADAVQYLVARQLPVVQIDRIANPQVDYVVAQNRAAMRELAGHLLTIGHRGIGVLTGDRTLSTTRERLQGLRDAYATAGLPVSLAMTSTGEPPEGPAAATRRMMSGPDRPTAIIAGNGTMTIGALKALRDLGLRVPDDVAVVSFDDFSWADVLSPRLTTIAQPEDEIGRWAVRLLVDRLEHPGRPAVRKRLPAELRHRDSCGCRGAEALDGVGAAESTDAAQAAQTAPTPGHNLH